MPGFSMTDNLEQILTELDRATRNPANEARAEVAVRALAALPAGQAGLVLAAVQPWLADEDPDRRWWAARALAVLPGPEPATLLSACLGDPDPAVRQCAALGLRELAARQAGSIDAAIPTLVERLGDPHALVRRLAGEALVTAGSAAVPALLEVLSGATQPARLEAVRTLAHIGDRRSIPALFELLDDESALTVYWAEEGLERMGVGMAFFMPE